MRHVGASAAIAAILAILLLAPARAADSAASRALPWDSGDPTPAEQYALELINRARANPTAEGIRLGINIAEGLNTTQQALIQPRPPLAMNKILLGIARAHSKDMWTRSFFAHINPDGKSPFDRMIAAGYNFITAGENIATSGVSAAPSTLEDSLMLDANIAGRPHRVNLLDIRQGQIFQEVGVGYFSGPNSNSQGFKDFLTEDFATSPQGPFIVGVVYNDTNSNGFYDIGEGMAGVTVSANVGNFFAVTSTSGGYAFPIPTSGNLIVTAAGGPLAAPITKTIVLTGQNIKLDFVPNTAGTGGGASGVPVVTSSPFAIGQVGVPFSYPITAIGSQPITFTTTQLPAGLALQGTTIVGTPLVPGTTLVTITARNSLGSTTFTLAITIYNPIPAGVSLGPPQPNSGGVGGKGPAPIPCFNQNSNGGTGPISITFDPSCSYVPVSPDPALTYLYTVNWDFGDGTPPITFGPNADPSQVLITVTKAYAGEGKYTVTMRLDVTIQSLDSAGRTTRDTGPSAFVQHFVRIANANFPPNVTLDNTSSPPDGTLPYTLTVDPSSSNDEDGYIVWSAIDWGDGSCDLINQALPVIPSVPMRHTYITPGTYKVTLSVVDNGRMPPGSFTLQSLPPCTDPAGALQVFKSLQTSLFQTNPGVFGVQFTDITINPLALQQRLDPRFDPILRQTFLFVDVPANMSSIKGQFRVNFSQVNSDSFDVTFKSNMDIATLATMRINVRVGSGPGAFAPPVLVTDPRGKAVTGNLLFAFDTRKKTLRLKVSKVALAAAFGLQNATVVNGNVDVPVSLAIVNGPTLGAIVRFVYNAKSGQSGIGKLPRR